MASSHGLGKGLSSLIPNKVVPDDASRVSVKSSSPSAPSVSRNDTSSPASLARSPFATGSHPLKTTPLGADRSPEAIAPPPATPLPASDSNIDRPVSDAHEALPSGKALLVPIGDIVPNPHQPRIQFSEEKLLELAQSIREHGILQPLLVTRVAGKYELIAGERRLQAAKMVGLSEVPVVVREAGEEQKFEFAIIENIQRHDLNPIEEARAYERLSKEFHLSQEAIAAKMGRSRSAIANTMRLLQLPVDIQRSVATGAISEGHAKALLSIENMEKQRALFDLIVRQDLTVRDTETKSREVSGKPPRKTSPRDPNMELRERTLSEIFGTKVRIATTRSGGVIRIDYFSDEEFKSIFSKLSSSSEVSESSSQK